MKIIAWDVGIKNLAYCFLEFTGENIIIHDWNKINLLSSNNSIEELTCCSPLKKIIHYVPKKQSNIVLSIILYMAYVSLIHLIIKN